MFGQIYTFYNLPKSTVLYRPTNQLSVSLEAGNPPHVGTADLEAPVLYVLRAVGDSDGQEGELPVVVLLHVKPLHFGMLNRQLLSLFEPSIIAFINTLDERHILKSSALSKLIVYFCIVEFA